MVLNILPLQPCLGKQPGKQKGLQEWRDRVGAQQAAVISGKAARTGHGFPSMCGRLPKEPTDKW